MPHLSCTGVCDLLVQADVQVVATLIGQEEADGDLFASGCQSDVNLQLGLEHTELPETTPIAHDHGAHRFLNLMRTQELKTHAGMYRPETKIH